MMADEEVKNEEKLQQEEKLISQLLTHKDITPEEIEDLFNKNTSSFRCLAQILISRSSLLRHPLYHFPPLTDPGIDDAFNYEEPSPGFDTVGCDHYKRMCTDFGIVPISRVLKSLPTEILDLSYYGLTTKQIRAIMKSLLYNETVTEVILQDNWLTAESVKYIGDMLVDNNKVEYLNLKECRIKPEGIYHLSEGLTNTILLRDLDLSFNSLGDEGLLVLEPALMENMSIFKLNLSHNDLGDEAAKTLARILILNNYIEDLDLSWNGFNTAQGNKALFLALTDNKTMKTIHLAWNGIGTREAAVPIMKYLKQTERLEHLDISNNRLTGESLKTIRNGIAKSTSLISVTIGNNLITPDEALSLLKIFNTSPSLEYMNMENTYVNKDFVPLWKMFTSQGKGIQIGGILSNYVIRGPDTIKLVFERAKFLAMKAKKKKAQKDFGHFILQLPENNVSKQEFQDLVKKFKMKKFQKDLDLVNEIMNKFAAKKQKINVVEMRESYMNYYPDTALPPPKKKGKGKKGKKGQQEEVAADSQPPTGQPPIDGQPPIEAQAPIESQPTTENVPLAEGQPSTEGQLPAEGTSVECQPPTEDQSPSAESQIESQQAEGETQEGSEQQGEAKQGEEQKEMKAEQE